MKPCITGTLTALLLVPLLACNRTGDVETQTAESEVLEKNFHYEGTLAIPNMSDREEAIEVMTWVVSEFEAKSELMNSERVDLAEAREDLATWQK